MCLTVIMESSDDTWPSTSSLDFTLQYYSTLNKLNDVLE